MYSQFFGSYLLSRGVISQDQLMAAISRLSRTRIKIGTIAMTERLMTAAEVDECLFLQTKEDRLFGEIAVERGYLNEGQVKQLLSSQVPDFILLGQTLVEDGSLTNQDLQNYILDYSQDAELFDLEESIENRDKIELLIDKFFSTSELQYDDVAKMYLKLLFNSLIRFIGDDFTPLSPMRVIEYPTIFSVSQKISGDMIFNTTVDMDRDTAIEFANRYSGDSFTEFDEYVMASIEDFVNLHNGLFLVNVSNQYTDLNLELFPPYIEEGPVLNLDETTIVIPIIFPFGRINLLVSF